VRRQPLRINSILFRDRMASNSAAADPTKPSATASAPGQDVRNKAGAAETAGGEKKVKSEKECMFAQETGFYLPWPFFYNC
jgi:hypothetical protein